MSAFDKTTPQHQISQAAEGRASYWLGEMDLLRDGVSDSTWELFATRLKRDVSRISKQVVAEELEFDRKRRNQKR